MDSSEEIQHWLARNNLRELTQRFQTHQINSVRRLFFLNPMLIKELIPEIGLRMDFMECWSQFKLRGTLRDHYDHGDLKYPPRSIPYQNTSNIVENPQRRPMEIFELRPWQQDTNLNIVSYSQRQNVSQVERYNVAVPQLPDRCISYDVGPRVTQKSPQGSVELVEMDPIPEGYNVTEERTETKSSISIQDLRTMVNVCDENPFELILGHSCEDGDISTLQEKSNLNQRHSSAATHPRVVPDEDVQILSSEVKSIDSGWGSNSSSIQSPVPVHQNRRKTERTDSSNSGRQSKPSKPVGSIKELDLRSYLINYDGKSRAAVESFQNNGVLTEKDRSGICNAVARRLMLNKVISCSEYRTAAQKICELFPNECEDLYYCPPVPPRKYTSGKLVNKVGMIKKKSRKW